MVNATSGWAATKSGILWTTNGGKTWTDRTPEAVKGIPMIPASAMNPLDVMAFAGADNAWIAIPKAGTVSIFATSDAGADWTSAIVPNDARTGLLSGDIPMILRIDFIDSQNGWLMTSSGVAMGQEPVAMYRTTDGGATWVLASYSTMEGSSPDGPPDNGDKTGFAFASAMDGWLTGSLGAEPGIWLYKTADGGKTWQKTTLASPPGYPIATQFPMTLPPRFHGKSGTLPMQWTQTPSTTLTFFYITNSAGLRWDPTVPLKSKNGIQAWSMPDASHLFAISDGNFCSLAGSASSWHCSPAPEVKGASELQFIGDKTGFALVDGQLLATTNGGGTWARH